MTIFATAGSHFLIGGALAQRATDFVAADFASQTWTEIHGLEGLGSLGDTSEVITFDGIEGNRRVKMKGTRDAGTMEVVCAIDAADAGQTAVIAAERTPHDFAFRLILNDAPPARSSTVTMTVASPGVMTWAAHGLNVGAKVKFTTTGALPTGLTAGTTYYVKTVPDADTFTVSATEDGAAIVTSSTQSGTHTATTVPNSSERLFLAKVMSQSEQFDQANNVTKFNMSLGVNSNIVRINAAG